MRLRGGAILLGCVFLSLWCQPAKAQTVLCHDETRDVVLESLATACQGRVIDKTEADAIRARRAERVKRALQPSESAFTDKRLGAIGTGFFVSQAGDILTNHHVIQDCAGITVSAPTGEVAIADVAAKDEINDLALLKTGAQTIDIAAFNRLVDWQSGAYVTIAGYPVQGLSTLVPVFTTGQITGHSHAGQSGRVTIRAAVRRGNSGGPVLDDHGLVVGVIFARLDTVKIFAETRQVAPDVAIAVDQRTAIDFLNKNGVTPQVSDVIIKDKPRDLLADTRRFMTRVQCYK